MKKAVIKQTLLFEKVCTCGKKYEDCPIELNQCVTFKRYQQESEKRFATKENLPKPISKL